MPHWKRVKPHTSLLYVLPSTLCSIDGRYFIDLVVPVLAKRYKVTKGHSFFMHSITVKCWKFINLTYTKIINAILTYILLCAMRADGQYVFVLIPVDCIFAFYQLINQFFYQSHAITKLGHGVIPTGVAISYA